MRVDLPLIFAGLLLIFLMLLLYSGALLFALPCALLLVAPLCLAYFIYVVLLGITIFPALNLTSIFICIGIGADDIFVFLEASDRVIRQTPYASFETHTERVLRDAGGPPFRSPRLYSVLVRLRAVSCSPPRGSAPSPHMRSAQQQNRHLTVI